MPDENDVTVRFEPNGEPLRIEFGTSGLVADWALRSFTGTTLDWRREGHTNDAVEDVVGGIALDSIKSGTVWVWHIDLFPPPRKLKGTIVVRVFQGDTEIGKKEVLVEVMKGSPEFVRGKITPQRER